jgi:cyclopropane fatty-acyl-phospholipid synthase-like methyltransferase
LHFHARRYHACAACGLLHLDPADRLSRADERTHYASHENDAADAGYRAFLNRLAAPLVARLAPGARGLDYGSGPGPTLSLMLREQGFTMADYDPAFAPDPVVLGARYDFITCTEVAEHFHDPAGEFERLVAMLRPGGVLAVMTECLRDEQRLDAWRYLRDPTHVSFYRARTFTWIATHFGLTLEAPHPNVVFLHVSHSGVGALST